MHFYNKTFLYGLSLTMCSLDNQILYLLINVLLSSTNYSNLAASFDYTLAYFTTTSIILNDNIGASMSQKVCECLAKKHHSTIKTLLVCTFVVLGAFIVLLCVIPAFFLEKILAVLGIQDDLQGKVKKMVLFCLAAFCVRSVNDLLCQFMLCLGQIHKIGIASALSVFLPVVLSIFMISVKQSGFDGVWIALLVHQVIKLCCYLYILAKDALPLLARLERSKKNSNLYSKPKSQMLASIAYNGLKFVFASVQIYQL